MSAEVLAAHHCELGESPRWDDRLGTVRWIDITAGELLEVGFDGGEVSRRIVGAPCGALVLGEQQPAAVAIGGGWYVVGSASLTPFAEITAPRMRFNDAGVDSLGRIWSGTMRADDDLGAPAAGGLYRVEATHPALVATGLFAANGIAWSPDESTIYCVDSGANAVLSASFDVERGTVGRFTPLIQPQAGMADGIAVDREGGIWLATWGTGAIDRYTAAGRHTHRILLPTPNVTAVAFAGEDLDSLVVTTAAMDTIDDPLAGTLFVVGAPIPGLPLHRATAVLSANAA